MNDSEVVPTTEDKIVAAIYVVLPCFGLAVYTLFFSAILRSKELWNSGFFIAAFSIAIPDIFSLLLLVFYGAPSTALQKSFISDEVNFSLGAISNMGWFATSPTLLIQAVDRLVAIFFPLKLDFWFSRKKVFVYLAIAWFMGIAIGISEFFPCCYIQFFYEGYSWGYDISRNGAYIISLFDMSYSNSIIIVVLVINMVVLGGIRKKNKVMSSGTVGTEIVKKRERKQFQLFFQFFTLVVCFVTFDVLFIVIPMVSTSKWMGFGISCALMVNFSLNGIIYVFFNDTVKAEISKMIWKQRGAKQNSNLLSTGHRGTASKQSNRQINESIV